MQECSSTCIKRTAGNGRMDDGLNCERDVPGNTRQTNALSFYSLGNEVDKGRSRTASLIYKSIVIGNTDKFSFVECFFFADYNSGNSKTGKEKNNIIVQLTLMDLEYASRKKRTWREAFLESLIPWNEWPKNIAPFYVQIGRGRKLIPLETMLRMYPPAKLIRTLGRGNRGYHLRQLRHEILPDRLTSSENKHPMSRRSCISVTCWKNTTSRATALMT